MIRSFSVEGLNGKPKPSSFELHDDVNIITGQNGCGKTTLLKLMWFMVSGNMERIAPEINFARAVLETDKYKLELSMSPIGDDPAKSIHWEFDPADGQKLSGTSSVRSERIEQANQLVLKYSGSSIFFPTFRRIEGGFSVSTHARTRRAPDGSVYFVGGDTIQTALAALASDISVSSHQFIASISTHDVVTMLTRHYANISEQLNADHRLLSQEIGKEMAEHRQRTANQAQDRLLSLTQQTLDSIQQGVAVHSRRQEDLLRPFTALSELISSIFRHKGITVTSRITLGDATAAIASDKLSAGEKQMLSFLAYNAFTARGTIFIDEPEISLHVDWQRQLLPLLLAQGTANQFIVATHSPFIYSRYSDKELMLDEDRGDSFTPSTPPAISD